MTMYEALVGSGIDSAEAEVLLCFITGQSRAWLFTHHDQALDRESENRWNAVLERRRGGEPVAYIIGHKEFYGRKFITDARALIPRSCTESLIDEVKLFLEHPHNHETEIDPGIECVTRVLQEHAPTAVVDIGTGTGCIAITLAHELPTMKIFATDSSEDALSLAKENAEALEATRVQLLNGDILEPLKDLKEYFVIVSNPPYLSVHSGELQAGVREFEPAQALFAEREGKETIDRITEQAKNHPFCVGWVMECPANFAKL
jgi:release factor glutamine methyltransferase